ncbi:DUF2922 domain-containing protein [Salisediminibacterium beveridgei]|uniref:DUF2922 domain-containing protein n=1 Tax=Salisediminibacterium beveridgei TaxID=632773 RepID=A0A1D7QYJ7_9BACI|nr:DUF2922 domain-containing protein [Salisediminibacterium beveridgei]AOM84048.1 hypothetical protein BBEV_2710 [Salisediminibacterium beveridgei]
MTKQLQLGFRTAEGGSMTLNIDHPVEPANAEQVSLVMDTIIEEEVFFTSTGAPLEKRSARLVERHVEDIELI